LLSAGEAEIVVAGFAQTPDLMDHLIRLLIRDNITESVSYVHKKETAVTLFA